MNKVRAKKHLGQHFLTEPAIAARIAGALAGNVTNVLEIGPGTGILTRALLAANIANLKLIEIDSESVSWLHKHHPDLKNSIIEGDFLELNLNDIFNGEPFAVIGNFPYNISSQILFRVVEAPDLMPELVGMFQREVGQRITAGHGNKDYGILTVLVQVYFHTEYLFTVNEGSFNPPPKVKSGVIKLTRNERKELPVPYQFFRKVVKMAFGQRRKTMRNSIATLLTPEMRVSLKEELSLRPEQLSPEDFLGLAVKLYSGEINPI